MDTEQLSFVVIPKEEWKALLLSQESILQEIRTLKTSGKADTLSAYITAKEFMDAVRIKRTKFDELVKGSKIKTIKKRRKIYVPVTEVERYFSDGGIL